MYFTQPYIYEGCAQCVMSGEHTAGRECSGFNKDMFSRNQAFRLTIVVVAQTDWWWEIPGVGTTLYIYVPTVLILINILGVNQNTTEATGEVGAY